MLWEHKKALAVRAERMLVTSCGVSIEGSRTPGPSQQPLTHPLVPGQDPAQTKHSAPEAPGEKGWEVSFNYDSHPAWWVRCICMCKYIAYIYEIH